MTGSPTETIHATGHENVTAEHASTLEVTSDDFLTTAGDCILAIEADTVPAEFGEKFRTACQRSDATITIELEANEHTDRVEARGDPALTHESERSGVVRTSEYVDDRTIAVDADKSARDIDRELVEALASGAALTVTLTVE